MENRNVITFCSYNLNGYGDDKIVKNGALERMFEECTFLIVQETWCNEDEFIRKFKNQFKDKYNVECISANKMDQDDIKPGKPYGGVGICYDSKIKCIVNNINTISKSICAQKIIIEGVSLLLINVYMPSSNTRVKLDEYSTILKEVSEICSNNETDMLIIGGDWNADPSRNDGRTKLFKEFISNEKLLNALDLDIANVPYTFEKVMKYGEPPTISTIDHFLISPNLKDSVISYESKQLFDNFSDHHPLVMSLNIDIKQHETTEREFKPRVAWRKCNNTHTECYQNTLNRLLLSINPLNEALTCKNYKCTAHTAIIHKLYTDIISCCLEASNVSLPHTKNNGKNSTNMPGWNEHVKEHADRAKFWHYIWKENGRKRQGFIADIRRRTRARYHLAIRKVKKEQTHIRNIRMAEAVANNNDRELWKEVKIMSSTSNKLPNAMDGSTDIEDISNIFGEKYKNLYNSVGFQTEELQRLINNTEQHIDSKYSRNNQLPSITVKEVKDAINSLKSGKKEENCLYTDHFKIGTDRLFVIITLLFNCMLTHGIAPDDLLLGTMIPLIKNARGNKQSSDNYRSLTIGTSMSKIMDIVIQKQQSESLNTSDLQFGFKEKSSTSMCTFMVLETIEYYRSKGSNVHALLLDASKAFDRVNYIKLFDKLLDKGMCPFTVRLLINMYTSQKLQVKWNDKLSNKFDVTNGVRQGGVLSPLLFSIFVDDLLINLNNNGTGCYMGPYFVGALGYADDIILLSPTVFALKQMIRICEEYANEHSILFNGSKSKYLVFGKYNTRYKYNPLIKVFNEIVPRCEQAVHLGHLLETSNTNKSLIDDAIKKFNVSFHCFLSRFGSCNSTTKNKLLHQYCSAMYGSQLWDLTSNETVKICTQWRKAHRQALSLPYNTHCSLLPLIAENKPLECMLDCRYIAFFRSLITSHNNTVRYTAIYRSNELTSTMGRNMTHLKFKYDLQMEEFISLTKNKISFHCYTKWLANISDEYTIYASIIQDMLMMKEERCHRTFSDDECDFIIKFLCTI